MKFFATVAVLSAVSSTWASVLLPRAGPSFPACSQPCLANADVGSCSPTDDVCLCNSPAFISSTASCIASSCTGDDLTNANAAAQSLCAAVGVTLASSSISITSSGPSSPAATSSGASATATSPAAGSSAATSASSSASATSASNSPSNGARSNGVNALAGLAAIGVIAIAL